MNPSRNTIIGEQNTGDRSFRLAMAQMLVEGGRREQNLARAESRIAEAARHGADVVLLPEALTLGWTHPSTRTEAEPVPLGASCERLCASARRHQLYVCAGMIERAESNVYNSAILISPEGELLLKHRKIYELEIAHALYGPGDRLQVHQTPFGTLGLMICADAFAPSQAITRTLALMGADLILSPCAWAVPAEHDNTREPYGQLWRDNYGAVARDFQLWVAGVSNVGWLAGGPWSGRKCIGCSLLVGPDGEQALMGPYGEAADVLLYADIIPVPRPARGDGWVRLWDSNGPGRPECSSGRNRL